jgi:hypothetical protein
VRNRRPLAALLAAGMALASCDLVAGGDSFAEPCPDENLGAGDGYDAAARDCLWRAFSDGKAASFRTTRITPQRDPIVTRVTVRPGGRVEVFYDNSLDTFSNTKGKYTLTCTKFQRSVDPASERVRFLADGCRGGDIRALVI